MANAREHSDFLARGNQHDQQIQMLIDDARADRQQAAIEREAAAADREALRQEAAADQEALRQELAAFLARAEVSDRKHAATTELMQQMFGQIQNINQRLAS